MKPYARFNCYWPLLGDNQYDVMDHADRLGKNMHGSTIGSKTVAEMGLPIVASEEDEQKLVDESNASIRQRLLARQAILEGVIL